ncbi:response regulator transcription factor [Alteromonas lipotrueiana]|uniref:response regulator transcription factor n=1 Tax=Alteromonas lipotrueiana TaxID=2803815 RepID=UPI001C46204C|nr:response regulator transcription factor [Alteromonas lipotrueiana]
MSSSEALVNSTETPVSFKHSILIIDDDTELTDMLDSYLRTCGYSVTVADNGLEGLNVASGGAVFDLILLDVMMPGMDGFDVLKNLRKTLLTPVLMLTARGDDYDRILGLELGADDYLPKPFNHRELAARIKAILRRLELTGVAFQQQDLLVHGLRLSVARQQVSCDGQEVALTGTEFSILHLLMLNAGMLVTKKEISEKVLAKKMMTYDRSIDMHVSNLRKKIAAVNAEEKIKTIRGSGYLLIIG